MAMRFPVSLLIDLPHWIGDQLMAMPAVSRILAANQGGRSVLVTVPGMHRFLASVFPGTEIHASARRASPFRSAREVCRGQGRFDLGITLRNAARAKIALRLSARHAWGSSGQGSWILLDDHYRIDRRRHQVHDADSLLRALNLDPVTDTDYGFVLPSVLWDEGRQLVASLGLGGEFLVGLAPTSALGSAKRWPRESFAALAQRLRAHDMTPVVLIGPGEEGVGQAIQRAAGTDVRVLGAELDVAGLAALLSQLKVIVGVDSGPMHLAAAARTPLVALFGPTRTWRTAPLGTSCRLLRRPLECLGCGAQECPLAHHRCMRELAVDEVEEALLNLCENIAAAPRETTVHRVGAL